MQRQILLLAITAAALSSCTTAYRSGQTPDDVYFSPLRPQDEYVRTEEKQDHRYQYDEQYYDDRYLRMKVHNRSQWNDLDDWYAYDRYGYRANYYYGSYYNPYTSWNYYYNPYCRNNVIAYNPVGHPGQTGQTSVGNIASKPRAFNLASYTNTNFNNANSTNMNSYKVGMGSPVYNNRNNGFSNTLKQIFNSGTSINSSSNNNSYSPPSRSYSPSSSSGSSNSGGGSSSSGSSGGGGATRPSRGGN